MLNYRPPVFFWIAEYEDGKAIAQFDPDTGEENRFIFVEQDKLVRFGWYPFTAELSHKIFGRSGLITIPTDNPSYVIDLEHGDQLIATRENRIKFHMKGGEQSRETVYILGRAGGKVYRIKEDGTTDG